MSYNFDYFYGNEAEQYQFYMIPQLLFTDDKFKKLSSDAKILYGLLLDRSGLSFKNKDTFSDENGRTFIYFKIETAMSLLNCATEKATKIFKELEKIGLIEKQRQGLGKPTKIYVKHFNRLLSTDDTSSDDLQDYDSRKSRFSEIENQDFRESKIKAFDNRNSGLSETENQDFRKSKSNQTNINHTDVNQTELSQSVYPSAELHSTHETSSEKDRQTDRLNESRSFYEVLSVLGFDFNSVCFAPESEADFKEYDEADRDTNSCTIPYLLRENKRDMQEALKFLFAFSYRTQGKNDSYAKFMYSVITAIAEMTEKDVAKYDNRTVKYHEVIDRVNYIVHTATLSDWLFSFEQDWKKTLAEYNPKKKREYMKSCIWNSLNDFDFEEACSEMAAEGYFISNRG